MIVARISGVVVTWVVAIDPPGVRFPPDADICELSFLAVRRLQMRRNHCIITFVLSRSCIPADHCKCPGFYVLNVKSYAEIWIEV